MMDNSWSWSVAWKDSAPEMIGKPNTRRTTKFAPLQVKLATGEPTVGDQSENFHKLQGRQGHAAMPYLLSFNPLR